MSKRERLELLNRGTHNGKWTIDQTQKHDQDDWYLCQALTLKMGLSEQARMLSWRVFKQMDMRTYSGIESGEATATMKQFLVAFCVGAHIYNSLVEDYEWTNGDWKYYPEKDYAPKEKRYRGPEARLRAQQEGKDRIDRHQAIRQCGEDLGFTASQIRQWFETVRCHLPDWVGDS